MSVFDAWFEKEYPEDTFAPYMKVIRLSLKEVAEKAWVEAYEDGYDTGYDMGYRDGEDPSRGYAP